MTRTFVFPMILGLGLNLIAPTQALAETPASADDRAIIEANQCAAEKVEASGTYMNDVFGCHAQSASNGKAVGRECLQKAERKLVSTFAALERPGGCETTGDSTVVAARVYASVAELVAISAALNRASARNTS